MKTQIRSEVWETNSSSAHSFCFSKRGLEKCHMKIHEDGYVHITLDQYFGNDEEQFFNQKTKLKYIVTWLYTYYDFDKAKIRDEGYIFNNFNEAFGKYVTEHNGVSCRGVKVDECKWEEAYDYFDHQQLSSGWCDDNCIVSLWDSEACVEFIFNKYVGLQTGCD